MSGCVIWFTGLPCSGKTTLANAVANVFINRNKRVKILDGDALRNTICKDLGFSEKDREENIRRVANMALEYANNGYIVLCSLITPLKHHRQVAKSILGMYYNLCYIKAPLDTCIKRDVKGMYEKALKKELDNFTGVSSPYDVPDATEYNLVCFTDKELISDSASKIVSYINSIIA